MHDGAAEPPTDHQPSLKGEASERPRPGTDRSSSLESLLQELRVLLQGVQVLTGFLIVLPFYQGFATIARTEQWVYLVTFACSLSSLILFSAPAAQHRLEWPLYDRALPRARHAHDHHRARAVLARVDPGHPARGLAGPRRLSRGGGRGDGGGADRCRLVAVPAPHQE
jgi:hypothetical protein